ncbi:MAG: T9SS type A sorting domain-containing protein, partial [Ignavibacteriae bacterium]|nr:T9SS type A sorting domain-containing protein [Ignavibacteriota bacterium]
MKMNSASLLSGTQGSKPGFRFVSNDSCYLVYSESGPLKVWSVAGCSGNITAVGNQSNIPNNYALKQNYPNPFNPTTSIQFSIPKNGLVKLVVYDILGKEVSTLVNEVKTAGNYIIDFNASNLTSGIYFYKITSGEFSSVKKML